MRRAAIPCGRLLRRFLRLKCAGIGAAFKALHQRDVHPASEICPPLGRRRRPSDGLAIPASCNTFWPKQLAGGVSHTLVHRDRHWCLPYLFRDIILQDSAIGDPIFFQDLSLLSGRERLCAPNRRSVVKMSACRTPLDSRLTNATYDNSSDPILNPHDAWYKKPKPVSNPWHYTRYSFPLMRSVYAS